MDEYKYVFCADVYPRRRHPMQLEEHFAQNTFFQFIDTLSLKNSGRRKKMFYSGKLCKILGGVFSLYVYPVFDRKMGVNDNINTFFLSNHKIGG